MNGDSTIEPAPVRRGALIGLAILGAALGPVLGAVTNAVNGRVSPEYFRALAGWGRINDVADAAVAQGVLEGAMFGAAMSLFFTVVVGVSTRARCPLSTSARYLAGIAAGALGCWAAGGLFAMNLAAGHPEFFREFFPGVPPHPSGLLRYAWVGGSIWGLQFGGFASVVIASILFAAARPLRR